MKEVIFLFCLLAEKFLVSGNPLTQIIPALQTCPQKCNQNAYQSPTYYQNPNYQGQNNFNQNPNYQGQNINIPVLLQTPTQQIQNIPIVQNTPVITPNNNQLYQQQVMLQNQLATPVVNNQFANPVNQLSQMYMNKILSNPTIQTLLEPNPNLIYQNGPECPKHTNHIPTPTHDQGTPPTVVNNYFLLPPEFLNPENENFKPKKHPNEKRSREQKRERDVTNKRPPEQMRRPHHDVDHHPEIKKKHVINPDCPVHSRKESHRKPEQLIDDEVFTHSMEERERNKLDREEKERKRRKQHSRHHDREWESHMPPEHHVHQRIHPERHRNGDIVRHREGLRPHNEGSRPHNEGSRPHHPETKRPNIIIKIKEMPKHSSSETQIKGNSIEKSAEDLNQSRSGKKRHSKDEEIIEDFKKKFPAIPEEVVRKLLSYLRRQLQKQQLGHPQFYYPDVSFPLRYDQLFPHSFTNDRNDKRRRPNRRPNRKQKNKNHSNSNLIETTTNVEYLTSTIPTTTERSINIEDSNEKISLGTKTTKDDESTTTPKELETTTDSFPELGTEDSISDISNGIIDDYYPDFTQDKTYFESGEAFNIRNLRDNRYHYTTDRNYKPKHHLDIEEVIAKPFQDKIETTSSRYEVETEIHYRTPPSLESPDFITKQIVRHKPNSDKNISYKSSTYSDAKNPKNNGKNKGGNKKAKPDIQTVYAHSKVVKYGKVNDDNEDNVTPVVTYYLPDNMQYEDDGKTVIVAKRIPADHFWK